MAPPGPSALRAVVAYVLAVASGFAAASFLWRQLAAWRRGGAALRFLARFWIIAGFYWAFGAAMRIVAGPYWLVGPTRGGGYNTAPQRWTDIAGAAVAIGLLGATLWPWIRKGDDMEM